MGDKIISAIKQECGNVSWAKCVECYTCFEAEGTSGTNRDDNLVTFFGGIWSSQIRLELYAMFPSCSKLCIWRRNCYDIVMEWDSLIL